MVTQASLTLLQENRGSSCAAVVQLLNTLDIFGAAQENRPPLMDIRWQDVQHSAAARDGLAVSMLHKECHGEALQTSTCYLNGRRCCSPATS